MYTYACCYRDIYSDTKLMEQNMDATIWGLGLASKPYTLDPVREPPTGRQDLVQEPFKLANANFDVWTAGQI